MPAFLLRAAKNFISRQRYNTYLSLCYAEIISEQFEAAAAIIGKAQLLSHELGGQLLGADYFAIFNAEVILGIGQVKEAISMAQQVVIVAQKIGVIAVEAIARKVWGKALAALNPPQSDEAEVQMAECLRLCELGEHRLNAARVNKAWGIICRDRGNIPAAREHFEKAANQWKTSDIPWELEKVDKLIAELP